MNDLVTITDAGAEMAPFGNGSFPENGHVTLSPDNRWLACDTYAEGPDNRCRLFLYDTNEGCTLELGSFSHPTHIRRDWRCDLHPRWSRDGRFLSFDSVHEGSRQVYVADVSKVVEKANRRKMK